MSFLSVVVLFSAFAHGGVINDELGKYGLRFANDGAWSVKKNSEKKAGDKKVRSLHLQSGDTILEITFLHPLTAYQAEGESKTEYESVLSAYKTALTPYAGKVSAKLSCDKEFLPKDIRSEFAGQRSRVLLGYATERKTFGVCNLDEAKMEFAFTTLLLPGDAMVKVTAFKKKKGPMDMDYWKKLLAEFKLVKKAGGLSGASAESP